MKLRPLTPEEAQSAVAQGYKGNAATALLDVESDSIVQPDDVPFGIEGAARQGARAVIPLIAGRLVQAGVSAGLAPFASPFVSVPTGIVAGAGTSALAGKAQDWLLNKLGQDSNLVKEFQEKSEQDITAHPYKSMAAGFLASPAAGGGLHINPVKAIGNLKQAATVGAIQGGLDTATQLMHDRPFDPAQLAIAVGGGMLTSNPNVGWRTAERNILSSALSPKVVDAIAPRAGVSLPKPVEAKESYVPPHERKNYNPDWLLSTDPKNLATLGDFEKSVARLRTEHPEIPLTPDDLTLLSTMPNKNLAVQEIIKTKLPMLEGQAAPTEAVRAKLEGPQNVNKVKPVEPAEASAQAIKERDNAIDEQARALQQKTTDAEFAKLQAENQQKRDTQSELVRDPGGLIKNPVEALVSRIKEDQRQIKELTKLAKTLKPGDELDLITEHLNRLKEKYNESRPEDPEAIIPEAGLSSEPSFSGKRVTTPAESGLNPRPAASTKPTVPESSATIQEQMKRFRGGQLPAVFIPNGTTVPATGIGETIYSLGNGDKYIYRSSGPLNKEKIRLAIAENKIGELLSGYPSQTKEEVAMAAARGEPTKSVTLESDEGIPVRDVATTEANVPKAIKSVSAVAQPGDKVKVHEPMDVLTKRIQDLKPGDLITLKGSEYRIAGKGLMDNPDDPLSFRITMKRKNSNDNTFVSAKSLLKNLLEGTQSLDAPKESIDPVLKGRVDSMEIFLKGRKTNPIRNAVAKVIQEHPDFVNSGLSEIEFLAQADINTKKALTEKFEKDYSNIEEPKGSIGSGLKKAVEKNKEGGFILSLHSITKPLLKRIKDKYGEYGAYAAKKFEQADTMAPIISNKIVHLINQAESGLTTAEKNLVHEYLTDIDMTGKSDIKLPPELKLRADLAASADRSMMEERSKEDSPLVNDFDPNTGKEIKRRPIPRPGYTSQDIKPEVRKTLESNDFAEVARLKGEYINHLVERGMPYEAANKFVNNRVAKFPTTGTSDPISLQVRYAEGLGLPRGWRRNIFDAQRRAAVKMGADLAYHRAVESDPVMQKLLNLPENGRGDLTPEEVFHNSKLVPEGLLADKEEIAQYFRAYNHTVNPGEQHFESLDRLVKTAAVQTFSNLRDVASMVAAIPEIASPSEYHIVAKGLLKSFTKDAYNKGIESGSVRAAHNLNPNVTSDATGFMNTISTAMQQVTGSELINITQRAGLDSAGRMLAKKWIAEGNKINLEKWGPMNYETWDPAVLESYIAQRLTKNVVGSYSAEGLPGDILPGSSNPLKYLLSLSRWPIERFNRWVENVYEPAKQGKIGKLVATMIGGAVGTELVNKLTEIITKRKPKELSWEEYLKLGGKDTAYTLLSKANTVAYAGILSSLAFSVDQLIAHEKPQDINNITLAAAGSVVNRLAQWGSDMEDGRASLEDLPTYGMEILRDNLQAARLITPRPDLTGAREERLARHAGYMKTKPLISSITGASPFSVNKMYRDSDIPRLSGYINKKVQETGSIPSFTSAIRMPEGGLGPDNKPFKGYYQFIEDAQGKEARQKAESRDLENTKIKAAILGKAISQ